MTDAFDRASEIEARDRDEALQRQQERAGLKGKTHLDSARECRVCDEPIPEPRRRAVPGVKTCAGCQAELEHGLRQYAR